MTEFDTPTELAAKVGKEVSFSEWITVSQAMIDDFAELASA